MSIDDKAVALETAADPIDEVMVVATAADVEPPGDYDIVGRVATAVVTGVPLLLLVYAGYRAWGGALRWTDLVVLFVCYFAPASGSRSATTG